MKKIFLIITGILLLISVPVIVFFFSQQQELRSKAAPATTLSIQPSSPSVPVGETVICKVLINTNGNNVASAKISLTFDQTKFEAQSITNGTLAPRILNQGTIGVGTATITIAAESTTKPITGQGEISTLRLKAIGGGAEPTQVKFAADTFVAGLGENTVNVLVSNQPASITITGGSQLASNEASQSTTPTSTPIITPPSYTPTPTQILGMTPTSRPQTTPTTSADILAAEPITTTPASIGGTDLHQQTGDEMPTSGSIESTILLLFAGFLLFSTGIFSYIRNKI
jgi:hypothetical protein